MLILIAIFVALSSVFLLFRGEYQRNIAMKLIEVTLIPFFWIFLLGVFAQQNWKRIRGFFEGAFWLWIFLYFIVSCSMSWIGCEVTGNYQNKIVTLFLCCFVLSVAFSSRYAADKMLKGSDISYGVYIYHMVVVNVLVHCGFKGEFGAFLFCTVLSVLLAFGSWFCVERLAIRTRSV